MAVENTAAEETAANKASESLLDFVLDEALQRARRGEAVPLEEYCLRYPNLADELRLMLPAMCLLEAPLHHAPHPVPHTVSFQTPPAIIAGYLIIRPIGRGGMGVVYEAIQQPLGRHVALKVISISGLPRSSGAERFRREAETVARLHHTNIIPVFDCGEEQGFAYYAMQLIEGINLRQLLTFEDAAGLLPPTVVRDDVWPVQPRTDVQDATAANSVGSTQDQEARGSRSLGETATTSTANKSSIANVAPLSSVRDLIRVIVQVADGLAFAHEQGVLHRDIKPSNLMLDERGVAWIADFGLAKWLESDDLTSSGEIVGTLRYLAPERFQGLQDERSDVYSLGLTLFELLTQRPAFDARDRVHLIRQISDGPGPRFGPASHSIPSDLQRVVNKAIARDPAQRYQSARDLADDLQRWLSGYPVQASRLSWTRSAWFWSKRNPLAATLAIATLLALVVGSTVATVLAIHWRNATQLAEAETRRSSESLTLTRKALAEMTSNVVDQALMSQDVLSASQQNFLENVLAYNEELLALASSDRESRQQAAEARHQVAQIRHSLGNSELAVVDALAAHESWRSLSQEFPESFEYLEKVAQVENTLGQIWAEFGQIDQALPWFERALDTLQHTQLDEPLHGDRALLSATLENNIATIRQAREDYPTAIAGYHRAIEQQRQYLAKDPLSAEASDGLARSLHNLALALFKNGAPADAHPVVQEALLLRETLVATSLTLQRHFELQSTRVACGRVEIELKNFDKAQEFLQTAIDHLGHFVAIMPSVTQFRTELDGAWHYLAMVQNKRGWELLRSPEGRTLAEQEFQQAAKICQTLLDSGVTHTGSQILLGGIFCNQGNLHSQAEQFDISLQKYSDAIDTLNQAAKQYPNHADIPEYLVKSHVGRAEVNRKLGHIDAAMEDWKSVIDQGAHPPSQPLARINLGLLLVHQGNWEQALQWAEAASKLEMSPTQKCYLALLLTRLADKQTDQERQNGLLAQAARWLERAGQENPNSVGAMRNNAMFKKYEAILFPEK